MKKKTEQVDILKFSLKKKDLSTRLSGINPISYKTLKYILFIYDPLLIKSYVKSIYNEFYVQHFATHVDYLALTPRESFFLVVSDHAKTLDMVWCFTARCNDVSFSCDSPLDNYRYN